MLDPEANDSKTWRINAEGTLTAAVYLFYHPDPNVWFPASLLGHHALEMLLKSALIEAGMVISKEKDKNDKLRDSAWGHNLRQLSRTLAERCPSFKGVLEQELATAYDPPKPVASYLDSFDAYFKEFRYPKTPSETDGLKDGEIFGGSDTRDVLTQLFNSIEPFAFQVP